MCIAVLRYIYITDANEAQIDTLEILVALEGFNYTFDGFFESIEEVKTTFERYDPETGEDYSNSNWFTRVWEKIESIVMVVIELILIPFKIVIKIISVVNAIIKWW